MRFIGKWLIWIGGGALLYQYLWPLYKECMAAYKGGDPLVYSLEQLLMKFAMPVFVLGVICATALPELNRRRAAKKKDPPTPLALPPIVPPAVVPPPPASESSADKTPPSAV
jgi:hypothetical protein